MLAQLATVKARLGIASVDLNDDTLLTNMLKHASGRFDAFCNRKFERLANATYEFDGDAMQILPDHFPIESVASFDFKSSESEGWLAQTGIDYLLRRNSIITLLTAIGTRYQLARVTYTGGYVPPGTAPGAGQTALPSEIEQACIAQVAYWYQNRLRLGLTTVSGLREQVQQFAALDLLPHVLEVLKKNIRYVL